MNLLCLKCASADCTCGRLEWLVNFMSRVSPEVADATSEPVFGSIDCAAEPADSSGELEGLFVPKLGYDS